MRTFAQKQNQPEKPVSSNLARSDTATPGLHHHRTDLILHLQRTVGNQAVQRLLETQNETLEAGATNTASSRFAQDFSRIPIHPAAERVARTKPASKPVEQRFGHIARGGEALGSLRAPMESAFGSDFSGVRIHRDSRADDLNARAVTREEDIHFDRGEDPGKPDGRELVAHELAHVVQQRNAPALSGSERMVDDRARGPSRHRCPRRRARYPGTRSRNSTCRGHRATPTQEEDAAAAAADGRQYPLRRDEQLRP